jgi:hypothetical protein
MGILDVFSRKKGVQNESNTVLGQMQLGNQVIMGQNRQQPTQQLLYVTTSSTTTAGRVLDMSALTRKGSGYLPVRHLHHVQKQGWLIYRRGD